MSVLRTSTRTFVVLVAAMVTCVLLTKNYPFKWPEALLTPYQSREFTEADLTTRGIIPTTTPSTALKNVEVLTTERQQGLLLFNRVPLVPEGLPSDSPQEQDGSIFTSQIPGEPEECESPYVKQCGPAGVYRNFSRILELRAAENKEILITGIIDGDYFELALNLHVLSVAKYNICNAFYVLIDEQWTNKSQEYDMPVYVHSQNFTNKEVDTLNSPAFNEKSKLKLALTYEALRLGYTVFFTDLDVYYYANPFPRINCTGDCDIAAQDNKEKYRLAMNTGCFYVKPNRRTLKFFNILVQQIPNATCHDQDLFNQLWYSKRVPDLKVVTLPQDIFCVGRMLNQTMDNCVVYHANYRGVVNKKRRFSFINMLAQPKDFQELCWNATKILVDSPLS